MHELTHWSDRLREIAACDDAIAWAVTQDSPLAAWRACEDGSWLLWIAARLGVDRRLVVMAACKCARLALPHAPSGEDRPLKAIEAIERWAVGLATIEEVRQVAAEAAKASADAVFAAARAADTAFYASASATCAAYAAARAADRAAYDNVLSQCADIVRSVISEDVMREAWPSEEDVK